MEIYGLIWYQASLITASPQLPLGLHPYTDSLWRCPNANTYKQPLETFLPKTKPMSTEKKKNNNNRIYIYSFFKLHKTKHSNIPERKVGKYLLLIFIDQKSKVRTSDSQPWLHIRSPWRWLEVGRILKMPPTTHTHTHTQTHIHTTFPWPGYLIKH